MAKKSYKEINATQAELGMAFMKESKDTLTAFMNLHHTVMSEGAVTVKNKELIALGISIAARCDGCIAAHVKAALASNATRAEIVETINVAIMMGGGPSTVYGMQAFAAMDELLE
jgi:AhpD family alkylhydroperoxidase